MDRLLSKVDCLLRAMQISVNETGNRIILNNNCELQVLDCLAEDLNSIIRNSIVPRFYSHYQLNPKKNALCKDSYGTAKNIKDQFELFDKFVTAFNELENFYQSLVTLVKRCNELKEYFSSSVSYSLFDVKRFIDVLRQTLLSELPPYFNVIVDGFYYVSFKVFNYEYREITISVDSEIPQIGDYCNGCEFEAEQCRCRQIMNVINQVNETLLNLELLDRIAGQTITSLIQVHITDHIYETCHGIFDKSHLKELEEWLDNAVINWLIRIFNHGNLEISDSNSKVKTIIGSFRLKLKYFLYENFANSAVDQLFNIIIEFPESALILNDLKICMEKIDLRNHLMQTLTNTLQARILHPGVNTVDILTGYIAAIKAIRHLDNSGLILDTVTAPVKAYLRTRGDTVRRVVTGLTEEGPTDLSEELAKGEILKENVSSTYVAEFDNWEKWQPAPFYVSKSNSINSKNPNRTADIISMVVDIYGSKDLFMNEYRNLMADRLLMQLDFSPDKEIRNLELLKLRFGENLLHRCEVMLKDVADSKRINTHIQTDSNYTNNKKFEINSLIISAQFWPTFNKESLQLPEEIANEFNKYTKSYEAYKGNRTLSWRSVTGRVTILIEIDNRIMEMTVPPTQAVIIYHFQNRDEWSLEDLSSVIKVPSTILRRRIVFWQTNGLICETQEGTFKLIEKQADHSPSSNLPVSQYIGDDEDVESAMASSTDQREEELQVFWSYIVGMLTNLDSLPLDRIHQMLKLFASHGIGIEFSQEELKDFLQRKVREHKLILSGGVYQLAK